MITRSLKMYAKAGKNVLLSGVHGIGKTAVITEVFNDVFGEYYKHWRYFSGSTLDPWVDFIGIPKEYTNEQGQDVFRIVPPENFTGDEEVYAIFIDELNRSDPKVINSLMELLQFKSINGRKFPNLKTVWAAVNPADDEDTYSVERLDPAHVDRFEIQIELKNELNKQYFTDKYGSEVYGIANNWWLNHSDEISPRRMDYIIEGFRLGFDLNDYVPSHIDISDLKSNLASTHYSLAVISVSNEDPDTIRDYFTVDKVLEIKSILDFNQDIISKTYKHLDKVVVEAMMNSATLNLRKEMEDFLSTKKKGITINPSSTNTYSFELNDSQKKFIEKYKNMSFENKETHIKLNNYINDLYAYFKDLPLDIFISNNSDIFNINLNSINSITSLYLNKFLDKSFANELNWFYVLLAALLTESDNTNETVYKIYRKLSGSMYMAKLFGINKDISRDIYRYADNKIEKKPNVNELTKDSSMIYGMIMSKGNVS